MATCVLCGRDAKNKEEYTYYTGDQVLIWQTNFKEHNVGVCSSCVLKKRGLPRLVLIVIALAFLIWLNYWIFVGSLHDFLIGWRAEHGDLEYWMTFLVVFLVGNWFIPVIFFFLNLIFSSRLEDAVKAKVLEGAKQSSKNPDAIKLYTEEEYKHTHKTNIIRV